MRNMHVLALIALLGGCATGGGERPTRGEMSFSLKNGSKIVFDKKGCYPDNAKFVNASDKNVTRVSGSIIASNVNKNETIEEFMLSCAPAVMGGSSRCSILKVSGNGGFTAYGGFSCPDMQFQLMSVNVY